LQHADHQSYRTQDSYLRLVETRYHANCVEFGCVKQTLWFRNKANFLLIATNLLVAMTIQCDPSLVQR